ncbi:FLYWCH zinc finger domain [Brachionus plicatilis]|uniref:FLYWCH zinc finger domain n=1 Tax=Brachionus plicatilis TaxID=10195 RepID=A0A3M7QHR0_BRAPC|nr:FLYWCH zinc finger domain [Brachionus plicatilis]
MFLLKFFPLTLFKKYRNLPLVYAFLANKKEESYSKLFGVVSGYIKIHPIYIVSDFEKAVVNALKKNFPKVNIGGCYFHLASNIWKYIKSNGTTPSILALDLFLLGILFLEKLTKTQKIK